VYDKAPAWVCYIHYDLLPSTVHNELIYRITDNIWWFARCQYRRPRCSWWWSHSSCVNQRSQPAVSNMDCWKV